MYLHAVFVILSFWEFWCSMNLIISPSNKTKRNWKAIPTLKPTDNRIREAQLIDSQTIKGRSNSRQRVVPGRLLQFSCVSDSHKDVEAHLTSDRYCFCLRARLCVPVDRRSPRWTSPSPLSTQRRAHGASPVFSQMPVSSVDSSFSCSWFNEWTSTRLTLNKNCHYLVKELQFYLPCAESRMLMHIYPSHTPAGSLQTSSLRRRGGAGWENAVHRWTKAIYYRDRRI